MSVDNHPDIWGHAAVRDPKLPTYLRTPLGWSNKLTRLLWQRTFRHAWVDEHQLLWGNTTESYDNPIRWQQWEKPSRDSPRSSGLCGPNTDWMVTTAWLFSIIQQVWFWSSGPELCWCQSELRVPDGSRQAAGVATYPPHWNTSMSHPAGHPVLCHEKRTKRTRTVCFSLCKLIHGFVVGLTSLAVPNFSFVLFLWHWLCICDIIIYIILFYTHTYR